MEISNKKRRYGTAAAITVALGVLVLFVVKPFLESEVINNYYVRTAEPFIGTFDKAGNAGQSPAVPLKHCTIVWKNTGRWFNEQPLKADLTKGDLLLTLETWQKTIHPSQNILSECIAGKFDKEIGELGSILAKAKHRVYVRWNPDMEVPVFVYPWQFQSPQLYIRAFNDFARKLKKLAPAVKIVWGPSGYPGDTDYWPGNTYVDLVSITLGSVSEYSTTTYPFTKSVPEMLRQKLHRMRFINKPVMLLGSGKIQPGTFKPLWLKQQADYMELNKNTVYSPANYTDTGGLKPVRGILEVGVFDPNNRLPRQPQIRVEHMFTDWGLVQRGEFKAVFDSIINRHHDVIVTMEPWRDTSKWIDTNVLASTIKGRYDAEIKKLYDIISSVRQTVYLRFAHEMEIPIHRYAWQSQDPVLHIKAYRYFMNFAGDYPNIKKVWGPAGDRGSIDWYPGDDVVDYISIAIYGLPDKNITDPEKQEAFSTILDRKYNRVRFSDRPLFITEFGVKGPEQYQDMWLANAAKALNNNPHIFGICYFNLYDNPKAWGNIKAPDWSISGRSMKKFCDELK